MIDSFGRVIDYLRVSVTDRCNFRCVYCMPEGGFPATPKEEQLSFEEMARLVRLAVSLGVRKVRLTGGEPLLRKDLPSFVRAIAPGVRDLSCTTNGHLLEELAEPLARAGLGRVNVSLDTLTPVRFVEVARRGSLDKVLSGIAAAMKAGLWPIKINCVAMRGVNDDEAASFAEWTLREEVHVRFIEIMPIRWHLDDREALPTNGLLQLRQTSGGMLSDAQMRRMYIPAAEIRANIETKLGRLEPASVTTNGPARTFRLRRGLGTVGFISQISSHLCGQCNRLRLTHDGFLRPCLMSDGELDLREAMRSGATDDDLRGLFLHVVRHKPERHYLEQGQKVIGRGMSQIGG